LRRGDIATSNRGGCQRITIDFGFRGLRLGRGGCGLCLGLAYRPRLSDMWLKCIRLRTSGLDGYSFALC
jgi:hypothetical protein